MQRSNLMSTTIIGINMKNTGGEDLQSITGPGNEQSSQALSIDTEEEKQKYKQKAEKRQERDEMKNSARCESRFIGHIPDALAEVIYQMMINLEVLKLTCIIDGKHKAAPKKAKVPRGDIEIPYALFRYGAKLYKNFVRNKVRKFRNALTS